MILTIASLLNFMGPDMMVILFIVVLLFGAKKIPELARGLGRAVKEFSDAKDEIHRELTQAPPNTAPRSEVLNSANPPAASLANEIPDRPGDA